MADTPTPHADDPSFVARPADVEVLTSTWERAKSGQPQMLRLVGPFGSGRRALSESLVQEIQSSGEDAIIWRLASTEQENGIQWMLRAYGGLVSECIKTTLLRGKIEMVLNSQLPNEPKRVQGWFQGFVMTLREAKPDHENGQIQLKIVQDNPLTGLIEVVRGISRKIPVLLDLHAGSTVASTLPSLLLAALTHECKEDHRLMVLIHDEASSEAADAVAPEAWLELVRNTSIASFAPEAWGADDAARYLASRGWSGDSAAIAQIGQGRPSFITELSEVLAESGRLTDPALADLSLTDLVPITVDADSLTPPKTPPAEGSPKVAGADDADNIAYLAALLGESFPSGLVAELNGYDKDSIDDMFDAMDELFEEVQFSESMRTWVYRFKRGIYREGVLAKNQTPEGRDLALRVAVFLERFLAPRGVSFVLRAAHIAAEHEGFDIANRLRHMALAMDAVDAWELVWDALTYFDEIEISTPLRRQIATTLLDHWVNSGDPRAAEQLHGTVSKWAEEQNLTDLQAWLLANGARLDLRRQDFYRARDRARDASSRYEALGNKLRAAESQLILAQIGLTENKPEEAIEAVNQALELAKTEAEGQVVIPFQIAAQSELIRGIVARSKSQFDEAIAFFERANQIAGQSGMSLVALDAGINLGETLLVKGDSARAKDILGRMFGAARQIHALPRERTAADLLGRIEATDRNYDAALQLAQRALQISQQLNLQPAIPFDLHRTGSLLLAKERFKDALVFLRQAADLIQGQSEHPLSREVWYAGGLAAARAGEPKLARNWLERAIGLFGQDPARHVTVADQLARLLTADGEAARARVILQDAIDIASKAGLKDQRRTLSKQLEALN